MSKFNVTYSNGDTAERFSGHESVEAFCNDHFGSAWEAAAAAGAKVVMGDARQGEVATVEDLNQFVDNMVLTSAVTAVDNAKGGLRNELSGFSNLMKGALPGKKSKKK